MTSPGVTLALRKAQTAGPNQLELDCLAAPASAAAFLPGTRLQGWSASHLSFIVRLGRRALEWMAAHQSCSQKLLGIRYGEACWSQMTSQPWQHRQRCGKLQSADTVRASGFGAFGMSLDWLNAALCLRAPKGSGCTFKAREKN